MDATELVVIVLASLVVFMGVALAIANFRMARFAEKSLEHAMAWSVDQREFMRTRFDTENQELLLREARDRQREKDRAYARVHITETEPVAEPRIPIESDTQT